MPLEEECVTLVGRENGGLKVRIPLSTFREMDGYSNVGNLLYWRREAFRNYIIVMAVLAAGWRGTKLRG